MAAAAAPPTIAQPLGDILDAICPKFMVVRPGSGRFWVASTSLVRICEARSIESDAFSTAVIAWVGSDSWPVASPCDALVALACVCSSELIALVSAPLKLPSPPVARRPRWVLGHARRGADRADGADAPLARAELADCT